MAGSPQTRLPMPAEPAEEAAPPAPSAAEPVMAREVTLHFSLPSDAAARLARVPLVQAHRAGRARGGAAETIWLDTAEGALSAQGLILEAPRRGPRILRRLLPRPQDAWHPAQAPAIETVLAEGEAPAEAAGAPVVAVAAFTGRRQAFRLDLPDGVVVAELLTGRLRSVAAEREAARLLLVGPVAAVIDAARGIAAHLPLVPPLATLAEEARALATGTAPRPHRLGPPDTSAATSVEDAFLRTLGHLLEVLHQQAARIRHDGGPEAVHQSRVALRRFRSVVRVFRAVTDGAELRSLDARLRDVVGILGPARDWDVFLAGIGHDIAQAFPAEARIDALLRAAEARRRAAYDTALAMVASPAWRQLMIDTLGILLTRPWRDTETTTRHAALDAPARAFGRTILDRRWSRVRRAGAAFDTLTAEQLHELRLDGKRLRYAAEVFAPLFGTKGARRFLRRLAALQDGLGIANDAAVARGLARELGTRSTGRGWAVGVVEGWCEARVAEHRGDAFRAWTQLGGKDRFWTGD